MPCKVKYSISTAISRDILLTLLTILSSDLYTLSIVIIKYKIIFIYEWILKVLILSSLQEYSFFNLSLLF